MRLRYWCARCGQELYAARHRAGRRAKCPTCGYEQTIPEPAEDRGRPPIAASSDPQPSVHELDVQTIDTVTAHISSTTSEPAMLAGATGKLQASPLRAIVLETSRLQGLSLCLLALSAADLFVTFSLLTTSHVFYESNPVAQWFLARWNMAGMTLFKFAVVGLVIALGEIIERLRPGWGRFVLLVGCVAAAAVVWHGLRLFLAAGG